MDFFFHAKIIGKFISIWTKVDILYNSSHFIPLRMGLNDEQLAKV